MIMRLIFVSTILFLLSGCVTVKPAEVGIPANNWQAMTHEDKEKVSSEYRATEELRRRWVSTMKPEANRKITVTITPGQALFPPYTQTSEFLPVTVTLNDGECYHKIILQKKDDANVTVPLEACFYQNVLFLDPSSTDIEKARGTIVFPYLPVWQRSFNYPNINSKGVVKLTNAKVNIQVIAPPKTTQ